MSDSPIVHDFWNDFLASRSEHIPSDRAYYEAFTFGSNPGSANQLAALVLSGVKTATSSQMREYEESGRRPPRAGDLSIVMNGEGRPLCVIETIEANVLLFDDVDAAFAYEYGEGDRTLDWWRVNLRESYRLECAERGWDMDPALPLLCERFRVVWTPASTNGETRESR